MEINASELIEIRQLANRLLDLADRLEGDPVDVDPIVASMVAEKVSKRICLACGERVPEGSKFRRGLDDACYGTSRNRIRRGEVREKELILAGKMTAEHKSAGRPAKMDQVDQDLSDLESEVKKRRTTKKKGS